MTKGDCIKCGKYFESPLRTLRCPKCSEGIIVCYECSNECGGSTHNGKPICNFCLDHHASTGRTCWCMRGQ